MFLQVLRCTFFERSQEPLIIMQAKEDFTIGNKPIDIFCLKKHNHFSESNQHMFK